MTTKITLTYGDAELVVTGEYMPRSNGRNEFWIDRIEQAGADVTEHYRRMRLVPVLEDRARAIIEEN